MSSKSGKKRRNQQSMVDSSASKTPPVPPTAEVRVPPSAPAQEEGPSPTPTRTPWHFETLPPSAPVSVDVTSTTLRSAEILLAALSRLDTRIDRVEDQLRLLHAALPPRNSLADDAYQHRKRVLVGCMSLGFGCVLALFIFAIRTQFFD